MDEPRSSLAELASARRELAALRVATSVSAVATEFALVLATTTGQVRPAEAEAAAAHLSVVADELAGRIGEYRDAIAAPELRSV